MLYKPNLFDADYRKAEAHSNVLFASSSNDYMLTIARVWAERFRGVEIDTLLEAYTNSRIRQEMFVEIVEQLVTADALNATQVERFHRLITAGK